MRWWLPRRIAGGIASAVVASLLLVTLAHLMPGDPLTAIIGDRPVDADVARALAKRYGVDRSLPEATSDFVAGALRGDLGFSPSGQRPVSRIIRERIGATLLLGSLALLVNFTIGLAIGAWSALHPDTVRSRLIGAATIVGYALPSFAVGMLLVWLFAVELRWLPAAGYSDPLLATDAPLSARFVDRLSHLALPLVAMVVATMAVPIRQQRSAMQGAASRAWVQAARARGLSPALIAWRHCWRPALTPIISLFGLWLPMLVSGTVFVESVFAWPGLGSLIAEAAGSRDVPLVIGAGVLLIIAVQAGSVLSDVLYRVVDPVQRDR